MESKQPSIETRPFNQIEDSDEKKSRRWLPLMLFVYMVGVVWHCLHPIASILTGHLDAPRGSYIDENSLEPGYFRMHDQVSSTLKAIAGDPFSALCELMLINQQDNIRCHQHDGVLEVVRILPRAGGVVPSSEALVLVIPGSYDWKNSPFHSSILQLIDQFSSVEETPWLAKTLFLVTPRLRKVNTYSLQQTVDAFLAAYLGGTSSSQEAATLPPDFKSAIIRNLLVLDIDMSAELSTDEISELRILPHGRQGFLPNMDLAFLAMSVYKKAQFMKRKTVMVAHPYRKEGLRWTELIQSGLPVQLQSWTKKMVDLVMFERMLVFGPSPPHASALDRGIDALTIQGVFSQKLGIKAHAMFVNEYALKHEEYLIPNLLLLAPLIIRALTLLVFEIPHFKTEDTIVTVSNVVAGILFAAAGITAVGWIDDQFWWAFTSRVNAFRLIVGLPYLYAVFKRSAPDPRMQQCIQVVACMLAVYIHIPIAFGHVALCYPSALFWTPMLAFPSYQPSKQLTSFSRATSLLTWICVLLFLTLTNPSVLVPNVFGNYTPYVMFAYLPLHLTAFTLFLA